MLAAPFCFSAPDLWLCVPLDAGSLCCFGKQGDLLQLGGQSLRQVVQVRADSFKLESGVKIDGESSLGPMLAGF
jgi:hypothetical protein